MSYDFTIMKPRPEVTIEIESVEDLGERTLLRQEPAVLVASLSSLFAGLLWRQEDDGAWFGSLSDDDTWYEFRIGAKPDYSWSVCTSHLASKRSVVPTICDRLDLLAFDGQVNVLIWPAGHPRGE